MSKEMYINVNLARLRTWCTVRTQKPRVLLFQRISWLEYRMIGAPVRNIKAVGKRCFIYWILSAFREGNSGFQIFNREHEMW